MPAQATYDPIATTTLGSNAATITFNNISQAYTDLVLATSIQVTSGGSQFCRMRFNNVSSSQYSRVALFGASSFTDTNDNALNFGDAFDTAANRTSTTLVHIIGYSQTNTFKSILIPNATQGAIEICGGLWRNTAAITRIDMFWPGSENFVTGTTATLYGIVRA